MKRNSAQVWVQQILKTPSEYESKFVVHNEEHILFSSAIMLEAEVWIKLNQPNFTEELMLFLVPNHFEQVRLRMLKIKSLSSGEWMPTYPVIFVLPDGGTFKVEMLVDSGADVTYMPFQIGERLGYVKSVGESTLTALGVGSEVSYLIRENKIKIEDTEITIHLLWGQNEGISDILLGRLDIFDHFDVTFSQHRGKVIFNLVQAS